MRKWTERYGASPQLVVVDTIKHPGLFVEWVGRGWWVDSDALNELDFFVPS
jgi:hypothetical protein